MSWSNIVERPGCKWNFEYRYPGGTGAAFAQNALASSISSAGALLSGIARKVQSGDLVWIEYQERKARFRIVWVRESESEQKTQAAVHKVENEKCPWVEILQSPRS